MANRNNVIEANIGDLETMVDIFIQGQEIHHNMLPNIFSPIYERQAITSYLRSFLKPRNPFRERRNFAVVWQDNGAVGGYLLYKLFQSSSIYYDGEHWVSFVEDIAVDEKMRGKGVASQLMDYLVDKSKDLSPCLASANIWKGNEASEALFNKYGYQAVSKAYYRTT